METGPQEKKLRPVSFATHASRGLIRNQKTRRATMLVVVVVAFSMAICGTTLLRELLNPNQHLMRFIMYWLACAWFTMLAFLLALFDLLVLRAQNRAARRALRERNKIA